MLLKIVLVLFLMKECFCYFVEPYVHKQNQVQFVSTKYGKRPKHFNWREKNMVSPVKDQLHCTACWAFSAIGNLESRLKIYKGMEVLLSEQFLIDCVGGCKDKNIRDTFADISKIGGIVKDIDYYQYSDGAQQCRYPKNDNPMVPIMGYHRLVPDEELMAQYLYDVGPLSAGINSWSMGHGYERGTIDQPDENRCSHDPDKMDHAILIVGYSVYENKTTGVEIPYWIIKNSWGVKWGDDGYYYLERGSNACGISHDVAYAIVV